MIYLYIINTLTFVIVSGFGVLTGLMIKENIKKRGIKKYGKK